MAGILLEKGKQIYKSGQPMTALHLITKGKVSAEYPGGSYMLGKGDVVGICELCSEVHFLGYTTLEDTDILTYPINNMDALDDLLQKHPDVARLFLLSMFRQITILLEKSSASELRCASAYQSLMEDYHEYTVLCDRYRIPASSPEGLENAIAYLNEDSSDIWLNTYYMGLHHFVSGEAAKALVQEPAVPLGMLRKGSLDFRKTFTIVEDHYRYLSEICNFYFNRTGQDLFGFCTSLYLQLEPNTEDAASLNNLIERMIRENGDSASLAPEERDNRIREYRGRLKRIGTTAPDSEAEPDQDSIADELKDSLNTILGFAGYDLDMVSSFRSLVNSYKALKDKNSTDDSAVSLRKQLTGDFYVLYPILFERSLLAEETPMPVKMFLYFGYVDEDLAGMDNSIALYHLTRDMKIDGKFGVYTFYDWLRAIYDGSKDPSRNEFEEDYADYIHKQRLSGNITDAEASSLEKNPMSRVLYEMRNMFPSVNRVTSGRVTTYCPLFTAENVIRELNSSYVDSAKVCKALEIIRGVDYSAFYRESLDYDHLDIMGKQLIHLEFLPDVILMPNVGLRGVMWQEIEGKKRNSSGRMMLSIFHMEDINTTMIRLTGEFRWELCKRIQGYRWNDASEHSLTSDYCDYIQFYRKSHDLSNDAKERIKSSLQKAKNSFREMFVRDYIVWILFERNGSPRLNKIARKILFTYCPFPSAVLTKLAQNPLFGELMERRNVTIGQKIHYIDILDQKLRNAGTDVPESLEMERDFLEGKR